MTLSALRPLPWTALCSLALAACVLVLGGVTPSPEAKAATTPEAPFEAKGSVTPAAAPPGSSVKLKYTVQVHPGHFIYREATSVEITDPGGLKVGTPIFPKPVTHFDKFENTEKEVYEQTITIVVPATLPKGAASGSPLTVTALVRYRGCNQTTCFFPKTDEIKLAVTVEGSGKAEGVPSTSPPPPSAEPAPSPAPPPATALVASSGPEGAPPAPGPSSSPPPPTESAPASSPSAAPQVASLAPDFSAAVAPTEATEIAVDQRLKAWAEGLSTNNFPLFLFIVFLGGLASSLTPCVYPMIPITVGVIGARSGDSRLKGFVLSCFYVLGIAATYSALGAVAALTGGLVGSAFQNPFVIVAVAGFFFFLALGMLGVYNFALPSGIVNRLNNVQGEGYLGAFLIGLVGGVVCSPCVGPVAGLILGYMAQGQFTMGQGLLAMVVFSLGLGVLFLVVGTFSGAVASLPRSGEWMEKVKYVFAFIMMGAAVYYLGFLLPAAAMGVLWAMLLVVSGVTLGGLESLPEYSTWGQKLGKAFSVFLLLCGALALANSLFGGRLEHLEDRLARLESRPTSVAAGQTSGPSGIQWVRSEEEGMALARREGKPVMIDFTADWCVACKELEHLTFPDPRVVNASQRFVSISVDCTRNDDPAVKAVQQKYGVVSLPTIVFMDGGGKVQDALTVKGFMKAEEFLARMKATPGGATPMAGGGSVVGR